MGTKFRVDPAQGVGMEGVSMVDVGQKEEVATVGSKKRMGGSMHGGRLSGELPGWVWDGLCIAFAEGTRDNGSWIGRS